MGAQLSKSQFLFILVIDSFPIFGTLIIICVKCRVVCQIQYSLNPILQFIYPAQTIVIQALKGLLQAQVKCRVVCQIQYSLNPILQFIHPTQTIVIIEHFVWKILIFTFQKPQKMNIYIHNFETRIYIGIFQI